MTTAQRREEILALLNQADAPIAAKDLAARFGVSRQVIVQDLAVIRASRPNIISTNRGYILQQQETGCLREFKVRHTPEQAGQELNLIVDHGGRVKNISISHRVYGRITAEMDIRSRQDVQALREQRVHYEVGWTQRLAHQKSPIDRVEFHVINASYLYVWSVGFVPRLC